MIKIYDGREHFFQWDLNQKVIVNIPDANEVHFCNRSEDCSLVCEIYEEDGLRVADVPNILLQEYWDIRAYVYCHNHTKIEKRFAVKRRSKPADYVYTETELKNFDALNDRVYYLEDEDIKIYRKIEKLEGEIKGITYGEVFMTYSEAVAALNVAEKDFLKVPEHIYIQTIGIPDLWVMAVADERVEYEYIDDQTLADAVATGSIQIGYFVVSALETQKADFTDYAKKSEVPVIEYQLKENGAYTLIITEGVE